ncbi:ATP-binding protein [Halovivax limisalsi]|uniref:ATP-binding protein n=1 Tax=Halovivax limisalsi TaxID=1453760 RepID=UPI001FFCE999|nr:tetratricopeptide repeat protein [Halovivax limisalsi]
MKVPVEDLVVLHLRQCEPVRADQPAPYGRSVPGLCDVLGVELGRMSESVELLATLRGLRDRGLVVERAARVEGLDEERNVYELTDDGRARATEVRDRAESEFSDFVVHEPDGRRVRCAIAELDRYFERSPLVSALARLTDAGVVSLEPNIDATFVNRDAELRALLDLPDAGPTTLLLEGPPGVGKTELLEQARSRLVDDGVTVLVGACGSDTDRPYEPFADALGHLPALAVGDAGRLEAEDFSDRRTVLFDGVVDRLREDAADGPVVVLLEDLHWADPATIDMLAAVLARLDPVDDVRFACTYRPADGSQQRRLAEAASGDAHRVERVRVEPFDRETGRELIEALLGTRNVPTQFVEEIVETTGGLPLFIVEVIEGLRDGGIVDPGLGVYPDDPEAIDLPSGVHESVDRRLDALDADAIRLLEWGAVAGEPIPIDVVAEAIDLADLRKKEYVDLLLGAELLSADDDALGFDSEVIRQAVLDRVTGERERRIHEAIADGLLAAAETPDEERVARHLDRAGADERAVEHYLAAGDEALGVFASDVAAERFERAAALARGLGREDILVDAVERIGRARYLAGEYDDAEKHFQYVRANVDDAETRRRADRHRARMRADRGDHDEAIELAERALEDWDGDEPTPECCRLLSCIGSSLMDLGELQAATDRLERARDLAVELEESDAVLPIALTGLGTTLVYRNEHGAAIEHLERAASLLEGSPKRRLLAKALNNLGLAYFVRRRRARAGDAFERSYRIYEETGTHTTAAMVLSNLGLIAFEEGEWDEAVETLERCLERATRYDVQRTIVFITRNLAKIQLHRGDLEGAKRSLDRSIEIAEELGLTNHVFSARFDTAQYHFVRDDLDDAVAAARHGIRDAAEIGEPYRAAPGHAWLGRVALERGDHDAAITHFERALSLTDRDDEGSIQARCGLAAAFLAVDRVADAAALVETATEDVEEWGNVLHRVSVDRMRGRVLRREVDFEASRRAFERALETAVELDASLQAARTRHELGRLAHERGERTEAAEQFAIAGRLADEHGFERLERRIVADRREIDGGPGTEEA